MVKPKYKPATTNHKAFSTSSQGKGRIVKAYTYDKYFNDFNSQLSPLGIYMRDVDGDGNCLFRSIADQIDGTEDRHKHYREIAIKQITENRDLYKPFFDEKQDFEQYLRQLEENGRWGGHYELVALSAVLRCHFCLHMKDNPPYLITSGWKYDKSIRMYHLAYHIDNHYSSVRKIGDTEYKQAQNIEWQGKFIIEDYEEECGTIDEELRKKYEIQKKIQDEINFKEEIMRYPTDFMAFVEDLVLTGMTATKAKYGVYDVITSKIVIEDQWGKPIPKVQKKPPGPNEPCWCKSGRKFNKCCGKST